MDDVKHTSTVPVVLKRGENHDLPETLTVTQEMHEDWCKYDSNPIHSEGGVVVGKGIEMAWVGVIIKFLASTNLAQKAQALTLEGSELHFSKDRFSKVIPDREMRIMVRLADYAVIGGKVTATLYTELCRGNRILACGMIFGSGQSA